VFSLLLQILTDCDVVVIFAESVVGKDFESNQPNRVIFFLKL